MTILEDLKTGRLVVVPREADLADYDAVLLNDWGGGNVDWWQDYLRAEIGRANDFWRSQVASPDHTAGLIALVEGVEAKVRESAMQSLADGYQAEEAYAAQKAAEAERDDMQKEAREAIMSMLFMPGVRAALETISDDDPVKPWIERAKALEAAEARALAAEAERDALREALKPFGSGAVVFYENEPDDCVLSLGRWKYQEDGRARFYADVQFTVADVRRARALTEKNNG